MAKPMPEIMGLVANCPFLALFVAKVFYRFFAFFTVSEKKLKILSKFIWD